MAATASKERLTRQERIYELAIYAHGLSEGLTNVINDLNIINQCGYLHPMACVLRELLEELEEEAGKMS